MTTEYGAPTGYDTPTDQDIAMDEARRAAAGPMDGFVERLADRVGGKASVRAVFGDPIERDGLTVIPVAKVRWGFGGGAGGPIAVGPGRRGGSPFSDAGADGGTDAGDDAMNTVGGGSGGGGGATADPIGWLEIGPEGATFRPIAPAMPNPGFVLAAGATLALVLRAVAKLIRR